VDFKVKIIIIQFFSFLTVTAYIVYSYNFLLLARCQRCNWWRHRQWIICCWPTDVIVIMTSRHCTHTHTHTERKSDMPGHVFLPWALAFTAIHVVSVRTGVLHCFGLRLLFFVFLFQIFRMASLVRASLEFNLQLLNDCYGNRHC